MKKISTATAGKIEKIEGQKLTVGLDLGVDPNPAMTPPGSEDDVGSWLRHNQVNTANGGGR